MTHAQENHVAARISRDGSGWALMPVWQHRIYAMLVRHDSMRGMPEGTRIEDCPAYRRAVARRGVRLARHG